MKGAPAMKLDKITEVTRENFDEVEAELRRYECLYGKERPAYRAGSAAGGICFWPLFVGAVFVMQQMFPSQFLLPILGTLAATILGAFLVHLLASTAARLVCRGSGSSAPTEGSDLERAKALLERAKAACSGIPEPLVSWLGIIVPPLILLVIVAVSEGAKFIDQYGVIFGGIILLIALAIMIVLFMLPFCAYVALCFMLYRTHHGVPGLPKALEEYVRRLQIKEEIERGKREAAEEAERNRLRGDALYRQATSGGAADEKLIAEAAGLGSRPAGLYMGRKMMRAWTAGKKARIYTQAEMEEIARDGKAYFLTAGLTEDYPEPTKTEVRLGYYVFKAASEDVDHSTLRSLRGLKNSGKLSRVQEDICDDAIRTAVDVLDYRAERDALREEARKSALTPSLDAVAARIRANSDSSSSPSWNTIHDDLDALSRNLPDDGSWRDAE